ncbi:MAG: hypothetical protein AMXMBFR53_25860 [Gemmatimonadota bacterium]
MTAPVDLIRGLYDAFGRGDVPAVLGAMAPDIEWNEAENFPYADGNPYRGPGAVAEGVFMRLVADFDGFTVTPETFLDAGDTVVAMGRYTGTAKGTGTALDAQFAHVWWVADGRVARFQQYTDTLQANRVVGRG